ncbi:hypothetical protein LY11_05210 [Pedobacter cryoconitis]|uniref:Uncharacterized protein n=1 Tax=Pedobacter cryoconitis TaxID=188932 RepID=A0A327RUH4_9SPHI|nr:hypothetical protein LY11_05210 [Pedobacter cryoconitis]
MTIVLHNNHTGVLPAMDCYHSNRWFKATISTYRFILEELYIENISRTNYFRFDKAAQNELNKAIIALFNHFSFICLKQLQAYFPEYKKLE